MKEEHGVALTLLADEQLRVGALIAMEFQARTPTVSAPAQAGHELGEGTFFDKELVLAVATSESGQLPAIGMRKPTSVAILFEAIPFAAGAMRAAPLGSQFDQSESGTRHVQSV